MVLQPQPLAKQITSSSSASLRSVVNSFSFASQKRWCISVARDCVKVTKYDFDIFWLTVSGRLRTFERASCYQSPAGHFTPTSSGLRHSRAEKLWDYACTEMGTACHVSGVQKTHNNIRHFSKTLTKNTSHSVPCWPLSSKIFHLIL